MPILSNSIHGVEPTGPVEFACRELARYLAAMSGLPSTRVDALRQARFVLGTFEAIAPVFPTPCRNDRWDDAVFLRSRDGQLFISGPNPRSVLFSVYAYLEALGCRFLYPGTDGEHIPATEIRSDGFDVHEKASSRFRGAAPYPDAPGGEQYVAWMAKNRLNYLFSEYFLDARPGGRHGNTPLSESELTVIAWKRAMLAAARERGMLVERYGHGWGQGLVARYAQEQGISEAEAYEALRARSAANPAGTGGNLQHKEFCLSHPEVKRILVDHICAFLEAHADEQDVAGLWMGDGWDLACECERCRPRPFSAWYMDIVREVATRLRTTAPRLMIECLVYMTSLAPPDERPLDGLDNIIIMLGPMHRCYRHTLFDDACRHAGWTPDFRHNHSLDLEHFHHPLNGDYMDAVRGWQKKVAAPWYIFDYFNWFQTSWSKSLLGYLPDTLAAEAATLHEHGIHGMVPCHYTQSSFPTNLTMWTLAAMLWNRDADPLRLRRAYLAAHFGPLAEAAEAHMDAMRHTLDRLTPHKTPLWQEEAAMLDAVASELEALRDTFAKRFPAPGQEPLRRRLDLLEADSVLQAGTFRALALHAAGNDAQAGEAAETLIAFIDEHAEVLSPALHVKFARFVVKWLPGKFKSKTEWVI